MAKRSKAAVFSLFDLRKIIERNAAQREKEGMGKKRGKRAGGNKAADCVL